MTPADEKENYIMNLTVKDLKEMIEHLPDDMLVYVDSDAEGNHTSKLGGVSTHCIVIDEDDWEAEIVDEKWSADDACKDDDEWAEILKKPRILTIYPV